MEQITDYEETEYQAIQQWKAEEPGVISYAVGIAVAPIAWLVRKVVPDSAIMGALDLSNAAAKWLTDMEDVIRDGEVSRIGDLRFKSLEISDRLANDVHNWAILTATAEGGLTGLGGIFTAPIDIPFIITWALRTIHKVGVCYGYECETEADKNFCLSILAAAGANSMKEKLAALTTLKTIEVILAKMTWKEISEKAAQQQLSKEGAIIAIRALAKQLGVNITKRRALAAIPVISVLIGGAVNGWYLKDVGWAARRSFQERWLMENKKI